MARYDHLPKAPIGEILENEFFFGEALLKGDSQALAEDIALAMRANNGLQESLHVRLAPVLWKEIDGGVRLELVGRTWNKEVSEEWVVEDDEGWSRHREENTTYGAEQFLGQLFGAVFKVRGLSTGRKDDRKLIDAMVKLCRGSLFYRTLWDYPSTDDLVSAGNQETSILGTQGFYAASSPFFSAVLRTRESQEALNAQALSAACKTMMRAAGVLLAPRTIFQLADGRFELRVVGCCHRATEYYRNRASYSNDLEPATPAVADPIAHYLGVSVDELHVFKTTAESYEDIVEAERVADELELLGMPEPEDFIVVSRETAEAEEAQRAEGVSSVGATELSTDEELAQLVGLDDAKRQLKEFVTFAAMQKKRGGSMPHMHLCFQGNPGTGKTTLARIFGHMLYDAGLLPKRNVFVETDGMTFSREDIRRARRGVLFIDEAYTLGYGELAILVKAMEDCHRNFARDGFIVVLAGYPAEMRRMISRNPGMRDRIGAFIDFEDYTADGLIAIFNGLAEREGYKLEPEARELIEERLHQVELLKDGDFANGRLVRKIFERIQMRQATLFGADSTLREAVIADVFEDEFADLVGGRRRSEKGFSSGALDHLSGDEQLDRLIGLEGPKRQIREFLDYAAVQKQRGGKMPSLHMRFDGNPGTGKTTLARIIGRMMFDRGLLPARDRFVETDRGGLVGQYVGSTAPKTKRAIIAARHGVLFIDEAYALDGGSGHDFGKEALSTLVKAMEDCRENFEREGFVCIMAGYPDLMDGMVSLNPGLRDRFGLTVRFEDYTADELLQVFDLYAADEGYTLAKRARAELAKRVERLVAAKDADFANARLLRKVFERVKMRQAHLHGTNTCIKADVISEVFAEPDLAVLVKASAREHFAF